MDRDDQVAITGRNSVENCLIMGDFDSQIHAGDQMLLKTAQIFWRVTTDRYSVRKQRCFFLNLFIESIELVVGWLIVKNKIKNSIRSCECLFNLNKLKR